jgi:hypothetical protein
MESAKESTGSTLGAAETPGFMMDAARVCLSESRKCDDAMEEANR